MHGNENLVAFFIFDAQKFALVAFQRALHQANKTPDAKINMHHIIPGAQIAKSRFRRLGNRALTGARNGPLPAENFRIGEEMNRERGFRCGRKILQRREIGYPQEKTLRQVALHENGRTPRRGLAPVFGGRILPEGRLLTPEFLQAFALARHDPNRVAPGGQPAQIFHKWLQPPAEALPQAENFTQAGRIFRLVGAAPQFQPEMRLHGVQHFRPGEIRHGEICRQRAFVN